jgi:hypothetical protein
MTTSRLEHSIERDGDFRIASTGAKATVVAADCVTIDVTSRGVGMYQCVVDFTDGARQSCAVTVGSDGRWVTQ